MKQDIKNIERRKISRKKRKELHARDYYACSRFSLHIEQVTSVSFQPVAPQYLNNQAVKNNKHINIFNTISLCQT